MVPDDMLQTRRLPVQHMQINVQWYIGIIIVHLIPTIPYMIRMLTAVYQGLGRDFEEQAMILGANRWQILRLVTLPMLLPGVVAGALFTA